MLNKISVIIPVYNTINYVKDAVDSIIVQEKFLHEIIIINDGSTDGTSELLENLYSQHPLIKIIHTKNNGQGYARNLGSKKASGDFIYYFDSDDISVDGLFMEFQEVLESEPDLDLFCFSGESFLDKNCSGKKISTIYLNPGFYKRNADIHNKKGESVFVELVKKKGFYASPPLYIFRKTILEKYDIKFSTSKYEDEAFTHQLFIYSGRTVVVNDIYFKRRVRSDSTMHLKRTFEHIVGYIKTVENLEFLINLNFLKLETISILNYRKEKFIKEVIMLRYLIGPKITIQEKVKYYKFLLKRISGNFSLFIFSIKYPFFQNLRKLKKSLLSYGEK